MNPPNNAQVEQARINLATAQAAIATNSAILEAAGVAVVPTPATIGPTEISAVALKLPSLWPDNPAKWFLHCEGKFRLHRIVSQQAMFDHCIHAMSAEQSDIVMDLMERGPSDNAYTDLKATYLERRTPTTAERVQRLHALGPLGDQRPSDLLRIIERILGRTVQGDEIATEEFLTRLPERIQLIARAQADIFTVEQMAKMADRLVSVPVTHGTFSVAQSHQPRQEVELLTMSTFHHQMALLTSSNERMIAEVGQLRRLIVAFNVVHERMSQALNVNRLKMFRGLNDEGVCWYHAAWGSNARKCVNGCRQAGNGHVGR